MSVVEAFARAGPSTQTTQTTTLPSETARSSRGIQSLKGMFPTKNDQELRNKACVALIL